MTGKILRLQPEKGFGFIAGQDGQDYFFHRSSVRGTSFDVLRVGLAVTFEATHGPKGLRAEEVRLMP